MRRTRRDRRLRTERLEARWLLAFDPTGLEQEMLEAINRMRLNPQQELSVIYTNVNTLTSSDPNVTSASQFFNVNPAQLQAEFAQLVAVPPLAWSEALSNAAAGHNAAMIAANTQSHQLPGEGSLGQRATAAGYNNWSGLAENVFAYARSVFHGHAAFVVDWGNVTPGHRDNIMGSNWQEIGIDIALTANQNPPFGDVGPQVVTQDFGRRFDYGQAALLGVVFQDTNANSFYTAGEGRGGVTITVTPQGGGSSFTTTTMTAGGYQLKLPAGTYQVTASGGGLASPITYSNIIVGASNRKLDFNLNLTPNQPPTNTVPGAQATSVGSPLIFSSGAGNGLSIADPDAGNALIQVQLSVTSGTITLATTSGLSFLSGSGTNSSSLVAQGTLTAWNTALNGLTYTPPGSGTTTTLTIVTNDLGNSGAGGPQIDTDTVAIVVSPPVNQPPVNTVPSLIQVTRIATPITFSTAIGNRIAVSDPDAASLRVTLTSTQGVLSLSQTTGLSFSTGNGTSNGTMTFTGTIGAINSALNGLTYLPNGGFSGGATLQIISNDLGNSGTGGPKTDTDTVHIRIGDPFSLNGSTLTVLGTTGNDALTVSRATSTLQVVLNGQAAPMSLAGVNRVQFFLGMGTDSVTVHGGAIVSAATFTHMGLNVAGSGFAVVGSGGDLQTVLTSAPNATAIFVDSPGNDAFYGQAGNSYLIGTGFFYQAQGFLNAYGYSTAGVDTAFLFDTPQTDAFFALASTSIMSGPGHYAQATNFAGVYAYSTQGGVDSATFFDSAGADVFYGLPTYSILLGPGYLNQATGFFYASAFATAGGYDQAILYDSTGDDTYTNGPTSSIMSGPGYLNQTFHFELMYGLATSGGFDLAVLNDSGGNDHLHAAGSQVSLDYATSLAVALGFDQVVAIHSAGVDTARVNAVDFLLSTVGGWNSV